jgi:hypothetical protein
VTSLDNAKSSPVRGRTVALHRSQPHDAPLNSPQSGNPLFEYIRPNVKPKKSNSPSGTRQIPVLSSFTVAVLIALKAAGYRGWLVVEAEQDPAKAPPLVYARRGFVHLSAAVRETGW